MGDTDFVIENNIIKGPNRPCKEKNKRNVGHLLLNALINNDKRIAQIKVETGEKRTFNQIKDRSIRCALWLKKQGIGLGDVVTICTYNQLDACIPAVATLFVGAVYNAWYHDITLNTASYFMKLVEPKVIFACDSIASVLLETVKSEKSDAKIVVIGKHDDFVSLNDIMNDQSEEEVETFKPQEINNPNEVSVILFSSGTSGLQKAVAYSYDTLLENMYSFFPQTTGIALWYSGLSWISGTYFTFKFLLSGSTALQHDIFEPEEMSKIIEKYKVNWVFLTPYMMAHCCKNGVLNKFDLTSLKTIATGSTLLNPEDFKNFLTALPNTYIIQAYGLTELGSLATNYTANCKCIDSVGCILPNRQLKIADLTTGEALGPNKTGEICIKSRGIMLGYYKNPTATKETIDKDGWLHTGDVGHYDENGEIFVTDRLKEILKYRNHHIYPTEIELLLLSHSAIVEAAVVPVPHDTDSEHPIAFVKKVEGAQVTEEELIELSATLGDYKKLRGGVIFLDTIPRTSSGKISRAHLKEMAKQYKQ